MFIVQLWLLAVSKSTIHVKRRYPYTDVEILGIVVYLYILTIQLVILLLCQYKIGSEPLYVETIGFLGVALEAAVPGFQVFRNFRNQSVKGFSELVLLVWFIGDICKIGYHLYFHNPMQFVLCGIVQVTFDCILFYQFTKYNKGIYDLNKEPDEQRRLLSEDPYDYYENQQSYYDRYNYSSSSQFEAKTSHQRYLIEGKIYENDYDEAVMDPKPSFTSKSNPEEVGNTSFTSISNKKANHNSKGKNLAINIQEEEEDCPSEIDRPSFHNSLSSYRSYQYANIRNSNYYYINQPPLPPPSQSIKTNEEYDQLNSILSIKNQSHRSSSNVMATENSHGLVKKSSFATFGSQNSSIYNNTGSLLKDHNLNMNSDRSLIRSKSVQLPRKPLRSSSTFSDTHNLNSYQ